MIKNTIYFFLLITMVLSCGEGDDYTYIPIEPELPGNGSGSDNDDGEPTISDEELLDLVQEETFKYFWDFAEEHSGGAKERYHPNDPGRDANVVTTGGTGFGLMAILVAIERGFVSRSEAVERLSLILDFLENADRFHGAWPHWIDGSTGAVIPFSDLDDGGDLVETAFLAQGLICVKEYFKNGSDAEQALAQKADVLWKGVEWEWYAQNQNVLYWHWSPNHGFDINLQLKGYNEVLIAYVMAAASPDHGIEKEVYTNGWASGGGILSGNTQYGYPLLVRHNGAEQFGGPLFWAHYSYLGLDPRNLSDEYVDYWDVNVNHTMINYEYCVANPGNFQDYGQNCWGLTASYSRNNDGSIGYDAHSPSNDKGVIALTAAISSMPYTPEQSLEALHYFYKNKDDLLGPAGFFDAFSPEYDWVAEAYLAIDQGPQVIMIENYRTGLLWHLFMANEDVQAGLAKLGF
ncbi:MAG: beta-glucosidase [Muricauda sp.]|nr:MULTISPECIES: glucoamylase family protein [unclassified Allomuricauda]MAU16550.1 beta-glucosidase [Allomuricauda sp.]|tara:strand:+ start:3145 stop:4527 length:1383 start_codon:yes stop_codon:yes gene_type:complete